MKKDCKLCALINEDHFNPTRIAKLDTGIAFVNFDQTYLGRSMLIINPHYDSLLDIPPILTQKFMEDVKTLAKAINKVFQPPTINYLMLGNTVLHAHCHIIPRYPDAPRWRLSPLLPSSAEYTMQTNDFYSDIAKKISLALRV
ncbi:HIT family protein [Candidatus Leptofilum sp.]|uniref:HIT family protein n=1 Tax=Candidatus Leptofilum sp. TaxID=3241576 RepID=UPI003B5C1599